VWLKQKRKAVGANIRKKIVSQITMGLTDHYEELAFTLSGKEDHSKQRNDKIWLKFYLFIFLFFFVVLGIELRLHTCYTSTILLEPWPQPSQVLN
jgi:hypothetical protein